MASRKGAEADAPVFGVSAEFDSGGALLASVVALASANVGRLDGFSPVPVPGLSRALGASGSLAPSAIGGIVAGFAAMMGLCIYATAVDYVFDIGGRPAISWPAFVVPSVSFAMLVGCLAVLLAMLFTNRLPRLNHPAFNIPGFARVSQDRFFLLITPEADRLDLDRVETALAGLVQRPLAVARVYR